MLWIVDRLKEPSTYAGLAGLAAAAGISGGLYAAVSGALVGVFGLVAVLMGEKPVE